MLEVRLEKINQNCIKWVAARPPQFTAGKFDAIEWFTDSFAFSVLIRKHVRSMVGLNQPCSPPRISRCTGVTPRMVIHNTDIFANVKAGGSIDGHLNRFPAVQRRCNVCSLKRWTVVRVGKRTCDSARQLIRSHHIVLEQQSF